MKDHELEELIDENIIKPKDYVFFCEESICPCCGETVEVELKGSIATRVIGGKWDRTPGLITINIKHKQK